jgi:hypothetical protein
MPTERTKARIKMLFNHRDSIYSAEANKRMKVIVDKFKKQYARGMKLSIIAQDTGIAYNTLHRLRTDQLQAPSFEMIVTLELYLNSLNQ